MNTSLKALPGRATRIGMMLGTLGAASLALATAPAQAAGFSGDYAPANWTLDNFFTDGSVDTTGAPDSISITGGNDGSGFFGQASFTTTAVADGEVSFDWSYFTNDVDSPEFDPFGFVLNDIFIQLTDDLGANGQSGTTSFNVFTGDSFGFAIQTLDNMGGGAMATISNFSAPTGDVEAIPEPTTLLGLLGVGLVGMGVKQTRKGKQAA